MKKQMLKRKKEKLIIKIVKLLEGTFELDESSCHGIQSMLGIVHFFAYEIFKIQFQKSGQVSREKIMGIL